MLRYCLAKDQLEKIFDLDENQLPQDDEELWHLLVGGQEWGIELVCLNYFVSKILKRKIRRGHDPHLLLEKLLSLPDQMWITFQEFDQNFVDFALREVRQETLDLEESLIEIQNRLSNYSYDQTTNRN